MDWGDHIITITFNPSAASGIIPSIRAWEIIAYRIEWGNLIETQKESGTLNDITCSVTITRTFNFPSVVLYVWKAYVVKAYVLIYDKYFDDEFDADAYIDPDPIPFSIASPASGEQVYYDTLDIAPDKDSTFTTATDPAKGEGYISPSFGYLSFLLIIPILIKIKRKQEE